MSDSVFYSLLVLALYHLVVGMAITTKNFRSTLVFKIIPVLTAFFLGLLAFKVII